MSRREVEWDEGRTVPVVEEGHTGATIVLAHGAGAGQDHPFMAGIRQRLAVGHRVITFDYPFVAEGRRAPDRMPRLLACHRAVIGAAGADRVVLGGKSMGGRMASHLPGAAAYFFLGYPLVPIGKTEPRDTSHLDLLDAPMLFIQGTRDSLADLSLLRPVCRRLGTSADLHIVEGADHSFRMLKRSGRTHEDALDELAEVTATWMRGVVESF